MESQHAPHLVGTDFMSVRGKSSSGEEAPVLKIAWLYSTRMNIYGDRGNVLALAQRARWRGIEPEVVHVEVGEPIPDDVDIFFIGGAQDGEQIPVAADLQGEKGQKLKRAIEDGAATLAICGGYQLLGHVYHPYNIEPMQGIGVFDLTSEAGPDRFIGNVVVDSQWGPLVGFENHSGLTHLGPNATPMGTVRVGRGNNGQDGTEGAVYKNAVGCYLHGALLPKNPALTDWLVAAGLNHRYGESRELAPLASDVEDRAHASAVRRAMQSR